MNPAPEVNNRRKPRILVAPLDWGLGHATRCIPVIYELLKHTSEVWLAGEGAQETLLKQEFPQLNFLHLPGYHIRYGRSGGMLWNMVRQTGKILRCIRQEHDWLKKAVNEYGFDAVISDNRFGLYHESIPCIFMTHQLTIKSPLGKWSERFLRKKNYRYISRFSACWVPDEEDSNSLAGELSHPLKKPGIPVQYIGPLSRLEKKEATEKKGHLLVVLSGPEPQRTVLEDKIIKDIAHYPGSATIVRGLPGSRHLIPSANTIRLYNHLPADELNKEMAEAEYIISRSGYSTVMDVMKLQKKAIVIPTPGQTEQEYLGSYLSQKKWALCISQRDFVLAKALAQAGVFPYNRPHPAVNDRLSYTVQQFTTSLA